jgi:hypothetical protein
VVTELASAMSEDMRLEPKEEPSAFAAKLISCWQAEGLVSKEFSCCAEGLPPAQSSVVLAAAADSGAIAAASSAATERQLKDEALRDRRLEEEAYLAERTRQLEASALRLRDNAQKLKLENRRSRVFGQRATAVMPRSVDCRTATAPADVDAAFGKSECGDANATEFADAASACTNPVAHSTINEIIFESPSAGSRASMPVHSESEALNV